MDQLKSDIVKTKFENGHCEYIEGSDTYTHTKVDATIEADVVKQERRDSMMVDADPNRCTTVLMTEDNDDKETDKENDLSNTVVKTEHNYYYKDEVDNIIMGMVNDYGDCNDIKNCDVSYDGYSSDSTLVLDTKLDIEEVSDQMQNSCMENAHNLDVSCNPIVKQIMNVDSKAQNNGKIEANNKVDGDSTNRKKKLQDKLQFESTPNFILCDEIKNGKDEINEVNTLLITKIEINADNPIDFWETNGDENNLLVKPLMKLRKQAPELYSCTECDYKCKLKISLRVHMETHKDKKCFSCDRCNYKSKLRHGLNLHMKQKHADIIFCDLCFLKFKSVDDLYRHEKIHFRLNSYACHLCTFECLDRSNFAQHLRNHTGKKTYICQYCDHKFSYKNLLNKHMLLHTKGKDSKTSSRNIQSQELVLNEKESGKSYTCNWCVSKFVRKGDLVRHMETHSSDLPYVCPICEQKFTTKAYLNRHVLLHSGKKPYACQHCDKKFSLNFFLKRHMQFHTSEKYSNSDRGVETKKTALQTNRNVSRKMRHTCELCDSKFVLKGHLTRHMKTHSGEKAFVCDLCGQKFSQKCTLKKHMFTHTGERPFACDTCPYRCTYSNDLVKHKMTHTGEKPFACTYCDFRCNRSYSLITHTRRHTGEKPFSCKVCAYKCTRTSQLVRHMRTHTGEKRFSCDLCHFKCTRHCNLQMHMRLHTGDMLACDYCSYTTTSEACLIVHNKRHTTKKLI